MKNLNKYINEAWSGVKKQSNNTNIESWCDEMGIEKYTINSKGEIDVDGEVTLDGRDFKELPYKFGKVNGWFSIGDNKKLISLKNCPDIVKDNFRCSECPQLDSLEGCPKEVHRDFSCRNCKRNFTKEEVKSLCRVQYTYIYT